MSNSERYPEAWAFFVEHARNVTAEKGKEPGITTNYRVPRPDASGEFICHDDVGLVILAF